MKIIFKVSAAVFFLLIIVAIIPAFIPDEEYTSGAKQWLKEANNPVAIADEINSFNALAGFYVEADKDMVAEGARLIAESNMRSGKSGGSSNEILKLNDYWETLPVNIDGKSSELLYEVYKNPTGWLEDNQATYKELLNDNQILLTRFRQIVAMEKYSHTLKPDFNGPAISYSGFMAIKKLDNLSIIDDFINLDKAAAVKRLQKNINFSRLMLANSAEILEKMIALKLLSIDLQTYQVLLDHPSNTGELNFVIANLNDNERTMRNAFKGEFAAMSPTLVIGDYDEYSDNGTRNNVIQYIIMKAYLKPRSLENRSYENVWLYGLRKEKMTLASRDQMASMESHNATTSWQIYQDPVGYVLMAIATPSDFNYMDKIDHADAEISLINLKSVIDSRQITNDEIAGYIATLNADINPGYAGAKFSWNNDSRELSYAIPGYINDDVPRLKININN